MEKYDCINVAPCCILLFYHCAPIQRKIENEKVKNGMIRVEFRSFDFCKNNIASSTKDNMVKQNLML